MSVPDTIPFADFLDLLRGRKIPIGLSQYQDVARLCERLGSWPGCDANRMAQALGGLLGRNRHEAAHIEQLFTQHYADAFLFTDNQASIPEGARIVEIEHALSEEQQRRPRTWPLRITRIAAFFLVAISVIVILRVTGVWPKHTTAMQPQESAKQQALQQLTTPELPLPPTIVHQGLRFVIVLPLPCLVFLLLYLGRRRADLRLWAQVLWRRISDNLPGPLQPTLNLSDLAPPIDRADLDDMATILGRSRGQPAGQEINCEQTIQKTIERGKLPTFVFADQAHSHPLLILCDLCTDMRPWQRKVDALIQGLQRRGVALSCFYFDADAGRISPQPFGPTRSLEQIQRQNPEAALLIISTGSVLLDVAPGKTPHRQVGRRRGFESWIEVTRKFHRRAWLHPLADQALWRAPLKSERFPMRVLPMVRKGLLAAAYELAQALERRVYITDDDLRPPRVVTDSDVERLRQLLALFPDAPIDLAELLRQRICPEIPESALLKLWATSQDFSGERLVWPDAELSRLLTALQATDKHFPPPHRQEEKVRRYLLDILRRSEPAEKESLGHLRWRLACAMQRIYLHDPAEQGAALTELKELARGPIWKEVEGAVGLLGVPDKQTPRGVPSLPIAPPVVHNIQREVLSLLEKTANGNVSVPSGGVLVKGALARPGWLRVPTLSELAVAVLLACMLSLVGSWREAGIEKTQHILGYQIRYEQRSPQSGQGAIIITAQDPSLPQQVSLYRSQSVMATLNLVNGRSEATLSADGVGFRYYVTAKLPKGNLAYSQAVYVSAFQPKPLPPKKAPPVVIATPPSALVRDPKLVARTATPSPKKLRQPVKGPRESATETALRPLATLTGAAQRQNMLRAESRFKDCVKEAWGSYVTISISVDNSGTVQKADLIGPLGTSASGRCISEQIRKQRFPPFTEGASKQFVWSYQFPNAP